MVKRTRKARRRPRASQRRAVGTRPASLAFEPLEARRLFSLNSGAIIRTVAGDGGFAFNGDNVAATATSLWEPTGVAIDSSGDLFIADTVNSRVREVNHVTGVITTVAGDGTFGYTGDNGPATAAALGWITGLAVDSSGDVFISDPNANRVREVNHVTGIITTVAGDGTGGFSGDNGAATAAEISNPSGLAIDSAGDLFFSDADNNRVREVNALTGVITTVVGTGYGLFLGDGIPATAASLSMPQQLAFDSSGDLFIADSWENRVREVNMTTGIITTVAGNGTGGYSGDNGPATAAEIDGIDGIAVDSSGDLYIADTGNNRIREVNLATGIITTLSGNSTSGYTGDNGLATAAEFAGPMNLAVDAAGDLVVSDHENNRVREISNLSPTVSASDGGGTYNGIAYAGTATVDGWGSLQGVTPTINYYSGTAASGSALLSPPSLAGTYTILASFAGSTNFSSAEGSAAFTITPAVPTVSVFDGGGTFNGAPDAASAHVGGVGSQSTPAASLEGVTPGLVYYAGTAASGSALSQAPSSAGIYTVLASFAGSADYVSAAASTSFTIARATPVVSVRDLGGTYTDTPFPATATVNGSASLETVAPTFTYYSGSAATGTALSGAPTTVGTYTALAAFAGSTDYAPVTASTTFTITKAAAKVAVQDAGGTYDALPFPASETVSGVGAQSVPAASLEGVTPTVSYYSGTSASGSPLSGAPSNAGTYTVLASFAGSTDYSSAQSSAATFVILPAPTVVSVVASTSSAADGQQVVFTATVSASPVPNEGTVTFALGSSTLGTAPVNGGVATLTISTLPVGVDAVSAAYADIGGNYQASSTGTISTVAGTDQGAPIGGYSGDGGPATSAEMYWPQRVAVDSAGDIFIADTQNNRIREVNHLTGIITTVAGNGVGAGVPDEGGYSGDGGPATAAELDSPEAIAVDSAGDLFIADTFSDRVREVNAVTGLITTVVGNGVSGDSGYGGPATAAEIGAPTGLALDSAGNLFIAEPGDSRILELTTAGIVTSVAGTGTDWFSGDGGPATAAELSEPEEVAVDSAGDLLIADWGNQRIREVAPNGIIYSLSGDNAQMSTGDGGLATGASLDNPTGVAVDSAGDVFIVQGSGSSVVREVQPNGIINTIAGIGRYGIDDTTGPANETALFDPTGAVVDDANVLIIADSSNNQIRQVPLPATVTVQPLDQQPLVTNATADENGQSTSGLVIRPSAGETATVMDFQITNISGGTLYLNNGTTPVVDGEFITLTQGAAGLKFSPAANSISAGSFDVQQATMTMASGLVGSTTAASISVTVVSPSSSVAPLDYRTSATSVQVSWSGTPGTGGPITSYLITVTYAPIGSSDFQPFTSYQTQQSPPETSTTFTSLLPGYTYRFYSQATDQSQNPEPAHTTPDTTLIVQALPWQNSVQPLAVLGGTSVVPADALAIIDYLNLHPGDSSLPAAAPGSADYYDVLGQGSVVPADVLAVINFLNLNPATQDVAPAVAAPAAAATPDGTNGAIVGAVTQPVGIAPAPASIAIDLAANAAESDVLSVTPAVMAVSSLPSSGGAAPPANVAPAPSDGPTQDATVVPASPSPSDQAAADASFADLSASWWDEPRSPGE